MEIKFEFGYKVWAFLGQRYTCFVKSASITERCEIKSFRGVHLSGKSNADVEVIDFDNTIVHYLPSGLHKLFLRLIGVRVGMCDLKEITSRDLVGLENLEQLCLINNNLISVPNDLLKKTRKIKAISFYGNRLEFVSSKLLAPIPEDQWKFVSFRDNRNIDAVYDSREPEGMTIKRLKGIIDSACLPPTAVSHVQNMQKKVVRGFSSLWELREFSDFTIIVDSSKIRVHKCVLAVQSPALASLFKKDHQAKDDNKLEIKGFSFGAVEDFLRCLYTGKIKDKKNSIEIFALASEYKVPELKALCELIAVEEMDDTTAVQAFTLGNLYKSDKMTDKAFAIIKEMFSDLKIPDKFKNQPDKVLKIVQKKKDFDDSKKRLQMQFEHDIQEVTKMVCGDKIADLKLSDNKI